MVVNSGVVHLNLQNLTIAHGFASGSDGGAIFNNGTLTVTNSTFSDNSAGLGGGIFNRFTATLNVTNCMFSGNRAVSSNGGGIANFGTALVTNSTFSLNGAINGGGIANDAGTATVTNSTFSGNSAQFGGGIENVGTLTVTNSTFSNNSSVVGGGGIDNEPLGSTTLKGTILAAEAGGNCGGLITDAGYNISDDVSCPIVSGTSVDGMTLNLDPKGLQNNGGPTQTISIEPNSPAVDFIPIASCKDQSTPTPLPLTTDQRGFPRPDSGNLNFCDAGAFELQTGRITVVPSSEKTQIARSISGMSDQVNMLFTFEDKGSPTLDDVDGIALNCDAGTNALNGVDVDLFEGTCASLATASGGLELNLSPFVVHTVSGHTYGTLFQSDPPDMLQQTSETVSVRIVKDATPVGACGEWTLNIQVAGLDTAAIGLGGSNPFALVVEDGDKNEGCFDITNAIVGNQIPPPTPVVRRGGRRGVRQ